MVRQACFPARCCLPIILASLAACGLDTSGRFVPLDGASDPDVVDDGLDAEGWTDPDVQEDGEPAACDDDGDCLDDDPCNGLETCSPATGLCLPGTPLQDGTLCGADTARRICLAGSCGLSHCGDGFIDRGAGESCEPPGEDECDDLCRKRCRGPSECPDDGDACDGEEYCDAGENLCASRNPPPEGTACADDPRSICLMRSCQVSRCGDGFIDEGGGEECEDSDVIPGDGCEPGTCTFSCRVDDDCDDGRACTADACDAAAHACTHELMAPLTPCREPAAECDLPEVCDGAGGDCPDDLWAPVDTPCRPAADPCDAAEACTGSSPLCPADEALPAGAACDDGNPCTYPDTCVDDVCTGPASGLHDVEAVSAGGFFTCALMNGGGVKCWGFNVDGQLGDGSTTERHRPVDVSGLSGGAVSVDAGQSHACAVLDTGGLGCWGNNVFGQLGDGTTGNRHSPVDVTGLASGVSSMACGEFHTCAVLAGGALTCWGFNSDGQVGDGTTANRSTPADVSGLSSGVRSVAGGAWHSCAVLETGAVKCWGENVWGQLGDGTDDSRSTPVDVSGIAAGATQVCCGNFHSCALMGTGTVACWGDNAQGQLGDGSTDDSLVPVVVSGLTGAIAVTCGELFTCALLSTGEAMCWGFNNLGQLGDGTTTRRLGPVAVTGLGSPAVAVSAGEQEHACAVLDTSGLMCWGGNAFGQLGDGTTTARHAPVEVACR